MCAIRFGMRIGFVMEIVRCSLLFSDHVLGHVKLVWGVRIVLLSLLPEFLM